MKKYFISIYCPPLPPLLNGTNFQTKEVFEIIKSAGVDNVYGQFEDNYGGKELVEKSLNICDELNITYFPRTEICRKFLTLTGEDVPAWHKGKDYFEYSLEEQKKFVNDFISEYKEYSKHPSFGGVMFGDESPMRCFKAIGVAKKAFDENFKGKEFHYNLINYMINDEYMFGSNDPKYILKGDLEAITKNRYNRYNFYLKNYFDNVDVDILSMDAYSYMTYWKDLPTSIHHSLHETAALFADYKAKNPKLKIMNYIQLGGWDNSVRVADKAEVALNINVQVAYNGDGFVFFPGVTPNDFINDPNMDKTYQNGLMGFVDAKGHKTKYVDIVRPIIDQTNAIAKITLNTEFLGVYYVGEFISGFDKNIDLSKVIDSDCIYQGEDPGFVQYKGEKLDLTTSGQLIVSVYKSEDKLCYLLTNNSIVSEVEVNINLPRDMTLVKDAKESKVTGNIQINIPAGENILLY